MDGRAIHRCLHVLDLEKSLAFYEKALGMKEVHRMGPDDGSWYNVFIANDEAGFQLELTWNRGRTEPYDNGGRDSHIAFAMDDMEAARSVHEKMGCICHVNEAMGLYFIEDPDGCWLEILPDKADNMCQSGTDVLAAMRRRKSIRAYSDEHIPDEALERILDAALMSASGRGIRPWELFVTRDHDTLIRLTDCRGYGALMLADADAAVIVAADPSVSDTWIEDCSIVMANMHLEASACGVGSCWIQARGRDAVDENTTSHFIKDLLDLPENLEVEAVLALGMPADRDLAYSMRAIDPALREKVHVI